jgi:hypothetical protein
MAESQTPYWYGMAQEGERPPPPSVQILLEGVHLGLLA